jgi:CRP/FNR family cyclic AMP-dependent transcriptional regulator
MSAKVVNPHPGNGLSSLPPIDPVQALENLGQRREFAPRQILFHEHDASDGFYVLRTGRVELRITGHLGADFRLRTCEPGDVIGLGATISGRGREITAEAVNPVVATFFPAGPLLAQMRQSPELTLYIGSLLAHEIKSTQDVSLKLRHLGSSKSRQ